MSSANDVEAEFGSSVVGVTGVEEGAEHTAELVVDAVGVDLGCQDLLLLQQHHGRITLRLRYLAL